MVEDEQDEIGRVSTRAHIFNLESFTDPTYAGYHSGSTRARYHNLYIEGNLVFKVNYSAGLHILQIDNINTASMT
jgi:hypothetical protein